MIKAGLKVFVLDLSLIFEESILQLICINHNKDYFQSSEVISSEENIIFMHFYTYHMGQCSLQSNHRAGGDAQW